MTNRLLGPLRAASARWWWWLEPWEIDLYGLRQQPVAKQSEYLSWRAMNVAVRPALNDTKWNFVAENKWVFANYFANLGAALPETYGLLHPVAGRTNDGVRLRTVSDLADWHRRSGVDSFVLKPLGGQNGTGVQIITAVRDQAHGLDFETIAGDVLKEHELASAVEPVVRRGLQGHLLQERLEQHAFMHQVNRGSPNSFRILSFIDRRGNARLHRAVMRSARVGAPVDAWRAGGVLVDVDETSGRLGRARLKGPYAGSWVTEHPDTGFRFADAAVPEWEVIRIVVTEAASMTPELHVLGWDVVLSEKGPRIVEVNAEWDLQMMQALGRGVLGTAVAEAWSTLGADPPDMSLSWRWRHRRRLVRRMLRSANRGLNG